MENYKGGLKKYWKKYDRLDGESGHRRPRRSRIELGGGRRSRKFWRIKISPRLRFFARIRKLSLKRILAGIRDAYVRTMLAVARSSSIAGGGYGFGSGPEVGGFGRQIQMKEYDEKMLVQMYRSILAQSQLVAADGSAVCAGAARIAA